MESQKKKLKEFEIQLDNKNKELENLRKQLEASNIKHDKEMKRMKSELSELTSNTSVSTSENEREDNYFIDSDEESEFHSEGVKISEGATSITYKVIDIRTNIPMCKKVLKYRSNQTSIKDAKNALKEIEVLHSISHPCICKAFYINMQEPIKIINEDGEEEETTTIALFLEFVDYSLTDILKKKINNTSKARIVLEIAHAMNFLHKRDMMHRDLKIENIMLNSFFETKLVDFGLVKISETVFNDFSYVEDSLSKGVGTLTYMSPEMASEEEYDNKTDVYSFGVVLHVIFAGNLPRQTLKEKVTGKKIQMPSPSKSISKFCIKLIEKCLSFDPSKRPSFEEILIQLRKNSYELASDIDPSILSRRDKELEIIENRK